MRNLPRWDVAGMSACFASLGTDEIGAGLARFMDVLHDECSHIVSLCEFTLCICLIIVSYLWMSDHVLADLQVVSFDELVDGMKPNLVPSCV